MKKAHLLGVLLAVLLLGLILLVVYYKVLVIVETEIDYQDQAYTWNARIGDEAGDVLVRGEKIDLIRHDIQTLIAAFNRSGKDPETFRSQENREPLGPPKLKFIDVQIGIISVEVINARYLTQRMGTTGAGAFMATATFTLTEHENIDAVNFVFEEGDHAVPGVYSRSVFKMYWNIENDGKINIPPSREQRPPDWPRSTMVAGRSPSSVE